MRTTFTHFRSAARATLVILGTLAACGGEATSPPGPPAAIKLLTNADLNVAVGDTFRIQVRVVDASGRGIPGTLVRASAGGALVLDDSTHTDGHGNATVRVVAPTRAVLDGVNISIDPSEYPGSVIPPGGVTSSYVEVTFHSIAGPFVQFIPHARTHLAGTNFALDSLFTAADKYGNATSWPTVQLSATNGWQVTSTTLTPPNATYTGTTVVSVTSGAVAATDTVSVVEDLRPYHWSIQQKCVYDAAAVAAGKPDSTIVDGTDGHAYYPGDPGFAYLTSKTGNPTQPAVEFRFTGTYTQYNHNGSVMVDRNFIASEPYGFDAFAQRPDTLVFGTGSYAHTATRVPGSPPQYVNPTWCNGFMLQAY